MSKSTRSRVAGKPHKPRPDSPLFPHQNGRWAKKVRGKLAYFGKWSDDPDGEQTLKLWASQKDELLAGVPQPQLTNGDDRGVTIKRVVNGLLKS